MRIERIEIADFRGFAENVSLHLGGKNLLLHGENGSGKTSLSVAFQEFFTDRPNFPAFSGFRNEITQPVGNPLTAGHVHVTHQGVATFMWRWNGPNPNAVPAEVREVARRFGHLDYQALLKMNFVHRDVKHVDLLPLLATNLLGHFVNPDPNSAGTHKKDWEDIQRLATTWQTPTNSPRHNRKRRLLQDGIRAFNTRFFGDVVALATRANELLAEFYPRSTDALSPLLIRLVPQPVNYSTDERRINAGYLWLEGDHYGVPISHPPSFFNEARLSAIALALYLAALLQSPWADARYPRVLLLDDVLMGLDLNNRLPVLRILQNYFSEWQIILLTHDRPWFELAASRVVKSDWERLELAVRRGGNRDHCFVKQGASALERGWLHYLNGDYAAAGVHLRRYFEELLHIFAARMKLSIQYVQPGDYLNTQDFWKVISELPGGLPTDLKVRVVACRQHVLNALAHENPSPPQPAEIEETYETLSALNTAFELMSPIPATPGTAAPATAVPWTADVQALRNKLNAPPAGMSPEELNMALATRLNVVFADAIRALAEHKNIRIHYRRIHDEQTVGTLLRELESANVFSSDATWLSAIKGFGEIFLRPIPSPRRARSLTLTECDTLIQLLEPTAAIQSPTSTQLDRFW